MAAADYITVTDHMSWGPQTSSGRPNPHNNTIVLERGYQALNATVHVGFLTLAHLSLVTILVGSQSHRFITADGSVTWTAIHNNETGSIPWGMLVLFSPAVMITAEIRCAVTEDATNAWKADTYGKLVTAYNTRSQEYEDKLATLKLQQGITIEGR
jgi:hypothetical protein